jgi:hypothetical protein
MRTEVKDAIIQLSKLKLSKYPYSETKKLISQLGRFGAILVTLHKGKTIMRSRPNYNGERFLSKSQLSYKPQQFNKTYQRASTPNMTMFYGCPMPDKVETGDIDNPRVVGVFEALPWLRDPATKGVQKITFGRWIVTDDINLIAIVQHDKFLTANSYTRELNQAFQFYTQERPELKEETLFISDFFANEFANPANNSSQDFLYMISASFTEEVIRNGLHGVYFPSVRVEGKGFNVAVTPEIADKHLKLVVAGECTIYKNEKSTFVDNNTVFELKENQTDFEYQPITNPEHHAGEAKSLEMVGVKSVDELLKK